MTPSPENLSDTPSAAMPVVLPVTLLITDVRSFAEGLRQAVAHGDVTVDASGLRDIDTAGLQLLLATRLATQAAGHGFHWAAESPGLRTAATAIGLEKALGLAA
jgi:anti-anti-sigma regulatory factor